MIAFYSIKECAKSIVCYSVALFSWRIRVDGRPSRRNKAVFSHLSGQHSMDGNESYVIKVNCNFKLWQYETQHHHMHAHRDHHYYRTQYDRDIPFQSKSCQHELPPHPWKVIHIDWTVIKQLIGKFNFWFLFFWKTSRSTGTKNMAK